MNTTFPFFLTAIKGQAIFLITKKQGMHIQHQKAKKQKYDFIYNIKSRKYCKGGKKLEIKGRISQKLFITANKTTGTMQAIQFTGKTKKLELVTVPIPQITAPNHVLVKIAYAGVCGTDVHIIAGQFPTNPGTKIYGHESAGFVVKTGSAVRHVKEGDQVAIDPNEGCGYCKFCHDGKPHYCPNGRLNNTIGFYRDGGWAEYCLVPANALSKLPKSISLEQGVLTEPMSCISHGWDLIQPVPLGSRILILGAGIAGNLWSSIFHLHGHKNVTIVEPFKARLELVKKLDLGYSLLTPDVLVQKEKEDLSYLFDVIIDCSGNCRAMEHAIKLLDMGGTFCIYGCAPQDAAMSFSPFHLFAKENKILAVFVNPFSFPKALQMMESMGPRYLDNNKLGIKIFQLQEYEKAMTELKNGVICKAVFKPS